MKQEKTKLLNKMKVIYGTVIMVGIIFSSCNKQDLGDCDYNFIENEIEFYKNEITLKTIEYQESGNKVGQNDINHTLYYRILDYYYENKGLINIIKKYPSNRISFNYYDSLLKARDCNDLHYKIVDTTKMFDTLYLHNVKFKYIKCYIKNSKYYDSMPDLKARIESYDNSIPNNTLKK